VFQQLKLPKKRSYIGQWNNWGRWFLAGNQSNHQNFVPSLISKNLWEIFIEMKQIFFFKKVQNSRLKKTEIFKIANFQKIFAKILEIGPWISRIDWCKGNWCPSTYVVMTLFDISSKTGKTCIFGVFRLRSYKISHPPQLCHTASRPYRLSQVNALGINQFY
jgi:hypothetical protein